MPGPVTIVHPQARKVVIAGVATLLAACSGGGGGGSAPAPTVQLQAQPSDVASGGTTTLTWSSTNTDSCQASGGWSGAKLVSGSETVGPLTATTTFTLQCTGRGGTASASSTVTLLGGTATVAGNLLVPTISRSDSDVNDPFAPLAANDTDQQAQIMPNPVVIGGYVNVPNAGPDGRSFASGDLDDWYRMDLVAGQVIELVMPSATPGGDDADLELYDSNLDLVDSSLGEGQVEQLIVPADGVYFIRVFVFSGAPMYRLSVGQSTVSAASSLRLSDDFVPGELIVTLKSARDPAAKASQSDAVLATRYGTSRKGGNPGRAMLLKLPADMSKIVNGMTPWSRAAAAASKAGTAATGGGTGAPVSRLRVSAAQQRKLDTLLFAKRLRADPDVRFADLNRVMRATAEPNDPGYAIQRWHYEQIQLPGAWDLTTGSAIPVAVVDTGVAPHPELASKLVDGRDLISSPSNQDGDGIDADPSDPGCVIGGGSTFHGTHVAGTIGANSDNNTGVAGVSWGARIMPVRVLDGCAGTGTSFDIIQGIRYAARLSNDSGTLPSQRAAVINMSFGASGTCDDSVADLFTQVRAQGVVVIAAAGNDATSAPQTPASCPNVISVASVGPLRIRAPYSNFGASVDLAAPGGDMRLDINGDGHPDGVYSTHASGGGSNTTPTLEQLQGTSMAAPHVSGVMALMLSANPAVTPAQIDGLLAQGALTDDVGVPGPDELGAGLINARKAIAAVDPSLPPAPPMLSVTPSSLAFGDIGTAAEVFVTNSGGGTLTITGVTASEPWLSATATSVDANGLGVHTVSVNRTGLAEGSYSGSVDFASDGGTVSVSVIMEVAPITGEPSAGMQYILLVDPVTNDTLAQVEVQADGSSVAYQLDAVPAGEYILLSGTDLNNDGFICDPAEACGAYPVENAPVPIVVGDGVVDGLDFLVAYRTGVPTSSGSKSTSKGLPPVTRHRRIIH